MDLPPEILIHIFNHLDNFSLKQCFLVSKNFHHLILNSSVLMKKFFVILDEKLILKKLEFIKTKGMYIKELKITSHAFYLIKLLKFFPNVYRLTVSDEQYQYQVNSQAMRIIDEIPVENGIELEHLQHLIIHNNNPFVTEALLRLLSYTSLKSFKLFTKMFDVNENSKISALRHFLLNQKCLTELTLANVTKNDEIWHEQNMKLNKLTIGWSSNEKDQNFSNFGLFLSHQRESLMELKLGHCGVSDVTAGLTKIRLFERLMMESIEDFDIFDVLVKDLNLSAEKSKISAQNRGIENLDQISFKNLKKLQLWQKVNRNTLFAAQNLQTLDILYSNSLSDVKNYQKLQQILPNLKILKIQYFRDLSDDFFTFLEQNVYEIFGIMKNLRRIQVNTFGYSVVCFEKNFGREINERILVLSGNSSTDVRIKDLRRYLSEFKVKFLKEKDFEELLGI